MVFAGEGLRAPSLPPKVNNSAPPLTGRAVSGALIGAAAAAGIASGVVGSPPAPINAPTGSPPAITHNAPAPTTAPTNTLLGNADVQRAPSGGLPKISPGMPSLGTPLAAASGGLPSIPRVGAGVGAANIAGALLPAALNELGKQATSTPGSPFYISPQTQKTLDAGKKAIADNDKYLDASRDQALRDFGDWLKQPFGKKEQPRQTRKGDEFSPPIRKGNGTEPNGSVAGKLYRVSFFVDNGYGSKEPGTRNLMGPISYGTRNYQLSGIDLVESWINHADGKFGLILNGEVKTGAFGIMTGVTPVDGIPDPITPADPGSFNPGTGLALPTENGSLPLLPPTGLNRIPPTKQAPPGSTTPAPRSDAPLPSQSAKPEASPAQPNTKPNVPNVSPSLPSMPPILPLLPSSGGGGSASTNAQSQGFPSPFTQVPGVRNQDALKPIQPPVPEQPTVQPQGEGCCASTNADLTEIKKVLGVGEYGVSLPLLTGDNPQMINNIPDLLMYTNRNIDATQGLFPIKVKVKQPDSSEKTITLTDNAHALEELFAMCLTIAEDADAAVNIGARVATEVIHTKTAVMQGNDIVRAIQKFFGFDTNPMVRNLKLNFTPAAAGLNNKLENDEIGAFLQPSSQTFVGTEFNDKQTALPILQRILHNSEIAMRAVWQPIKPGKDGKDDITGTRLRAANKKPSKTEQEIWTKLQETLKILGYEDVDVTGTLKGKDK